MFIVRLGALAGALGLLMSSVGYAHVGRAQAPERGVVRNHFGAAFSSLVAGGGFKGGHVLGATDAKGMEVVERPVYPWDLTGTIYELMGIDPESLLQHPLGQKVRITPVAQDGFKSGGRLKELV